MPAYYNEIDPFAAAWLRELIRQGHIAPGDVDTRSIKDVSPDDLRPYTQCHFFAGIGVWSYALRLAGWPDDRSVWTGSCPCQPFSAAGKGGGFADERHLWPAQFHLIRECRPDIWLGEQVASKDGLHWLDLVCDDLEAEGYAVGAVDTSSALTGAPHIRQRLRIGAKRLGEPHSAGRFARQQRAEAVGYRHPAVAGGGVGGVADTKHSERRPFSSNREDGCDRADGGRQETHGLAGTRGEVHGLANTDDARSQGRLCGRDGAGECASRAGGVELQEQPGQADGFWKNPDWLYCRDGKWRPVEPGTFPLAHGAPARVGRLRGYGNAVDAIATKEFIQAFAEAATEVLG